ncbi:putative CRISPR-associated RAMP protein, Cmr1 family [Candidatus Defluviicoccus seviourii]|uniref:CRISPR-associated RAMP protein, Cmr1 family n=2 Tax=root TaxID=1 RepID=A0A564WEW1_9PROT|nr:putative CRISPR-associated RAMP protein, Cmr1 family [uncultured Defluviicoccus sp.]VUX46996.1 putative CRISPR-associated RAMP protein, Cmr1 family [Candidatus Defluviicoccus seviourii]
MAAFASLHATYRVVTPMFLGDAEKSASCLSVASFRGILRFWWRARAYPRLLQAYNVDAARALKKLAAAEARLFGSAGVGESCGQSLMRLALVDSSLGTPIDAGCVLNETGTAVSADTSTDPKEDFVGRGARYLGYGVINAFTTWRKCGRDYCLDAKGHRIPKEKGGQLLRSCFPAGGSFTIALKVRPLARKEGETDEEFDKRTRERCADFEDVLATLKLIGLVGGLGARSRRGWGSLALVELTGTLAGKAVPAWLPPGTDKAYRERLRELLPLPFTASTEPMPFTVFSATSRVEIVKHGTSAVPLLSELGDAFLCYRGWKRPAGEGNFRHDHDGFKPPNGGRWAVPAGALDGAYPSKAMQHPMRVAFGLPHNYAKWLRVEGERHDRRASPLFFHIHPLGRGFIGVIAFLPARFLPEIRENGVVRPASIKIVKVDNNTKKEQDTLIDENVDYGVVARFLDGFTDTSGQQHEYFSPRTRKAILP